MLIRRAYKTEIDPNNKQASYFERCLDVTTFVYNIGLREWERQYASGGKPSAYGLKKQFNAVKSDLWPWVESVKYSVTESAFARLGNAFKRYFREKKDGTVAKRIAQLKKSGKWDKRYAKLAKRGRSGYKADPGYPQFKQRCDSFQLRGYRTSRTDVWLGRDIGTVRLKEKGYIPPGVCYNHGGAAYVTISKRGGRWYVGVQVEEEIPDTKVIDSALVIGVDFGLNKLVVCSDGTVYDNIKPLKQAMSRLNRLQRELARRQRGGKNWHKTKAKIARLHHRIARIRKHTQHHISHDLVVNKKPRTIVIENLNVSGMMANHSMAQAISDVGFYELRRQIEYKAEWHGVEVIVVDRWFPSSKTCSRCGYVKDDLTRSDREFVCDKCGLVIDRDYNAALNLAAIGKAETQPDGPGIESGCRSELGTEQPTL